MAAAEKGLVPKPVENVKEVKWGAPKKPAADSKDAKKEEPKEGAAAKAKSKSKSKKKKGTATADDADSKTADAKKEAVAATTPEKNVKKVVADPETPAPPAKSKAKKEAKVDDVKVAGVDAKVDAV